MQGHVRVAAAQPSQQGRHQPAESHDGVSAKRAEKQVEPDYVGFQAVELTEYAEHASGIIKRPATHHRKPLGLDMFGRKLIRQHGKAQKWIALQFLCDVESIFA